MLITCKLAVKSARISAPVGVDVPLSYNTILRTGQRAQRGEEFAFGQVLDQSMMPIYEVTCRSICACFLGATAFHN